MIRAIVGWSLRFRLLVVGIAAGVMAVGIAQLRDAPVDVLPEFTPPYVEIQTESLGLSAEEVEQFITVPLEANLLNGVEGVEDIRSQSVPGLSSIVLVFEPGSDLYTGRALTQERLTQVGAAAAPNVSQPPLMLPPLSSSSRVLMIGLTSEELSGIEQSVLARWTVRPRLMGVPGVANVAIWGLREQQLQVQVDPEHLRDQNVTLNRVVETVGNAQVASPLSFLQASTPGTGGFIETPQQRLQVRNVFDKISTPKGLGRVPVEGTGGSLRLRDVATVVESHQPLIGDAVVDDGKGLVLAVEKFPGANTLEVTKGVEEALDQLRLDDSGVQTDTSAFRPASFIASAIDNLTLALVIAGGLLVLILAAFLFQWRAVAISLVTIPVSLIAAALVLDALGETFNAISFAGLAVAIAVVIDDAVVSSENVLRRLRQRREAGTGGSTAAVVLEASSEVRSPLAYATAIALLAIVPVAVMAGRPGAFFEPIVLAYALAIAAAMVVALTLTPALTLLLARGSLGHGASPLLQRLTPRYDGALSRFIGRPRTALIAAGLCLAAGIAALPMLGTSLVPSFNDRDVLVQLESEPGTSNPRMTRIATQVSRELRAIPGVDDAEALVGRAVTGDRISDVHSSEIWVGIDSDADYDATRASIDDAVGDVPGVARQVVTYSTQQIRDVGGLGEGGNPVQGNDLNVLTGFDRPLVTRVYGQNLDVLRGEANKVRQLMAGVDGVVEPRIEQPRAQRAIEIEVDLDKARAFGIKPGDVRRAEAILVQGIHVGSIFEDQKVFEVLVQGPPEARNSVANVRNLLLDRPDGGHVRLGQIADVRVAPTPEVIERDAVSRHLDVTADVSGRSLDDVADEVEDRLANVSFPLEYHAAVLTQTTSDEIGATTMLAFAIAAAIAAFLLLQAALGSWRLAAAAFLTLPIALVGGALAVLIDGGEVSLGSLIGFLALLGIAARNAVMLIRHPQDLDARDRESFNRALIQPVARERLAPVLTTAAAIAAVMLPFVVMGDIPGLEIVNPMAVVVLGGLVSSTFLALFVLPAVYLRFGAGPPREQEPPGRPAMPADPWAGQVRTGRFEPQPEAEREDLVLRQWSDGT